jgi:hypothetical protein
MLWKDVGENEIDVQRVGTHALTVIKTNNSTGLELFLDLGADVEVRLPAFVITDPDSGAEWEPEPTLLIAADLDNIPLASLMLEKGAEVHYFDRYGNGKISPMHAARSAEMVQLLLDHDADPDFDDDFERRPLHWYAIRDNITAMQAILQHSAEMNPDGPHGNPLHEAAVRNLDTVEFLVEHGADVRQTDLGGNTPLHFAA